MPRCKPHEKGTVLTVGLDCGGYAAPADALQLKHELSSCHCQSHCQCCVLEVIALRNAGFRVRVSFISEIDPKVMQMFDIMAEHMGVEVDHKHADMTTRPSYKNVDLYCYSGPCQSFSTSGKEEAYVI